MLVDARDDAADEAVVPAPAFGLDALPPSLPRIIVHNKCDLAFAAPHVARYAATLDAPHAEGSAVATHVWLCALTGEGVALLEAEILRIAGIAHGVEDAYFARERHLAALASARAHLEAAEPHLAARSPALDLFAEELREAQNAVSSITGEFTADDLLGEIFSRFCIGK